MADVRVTLPRDHWVALRDPWSITESEREDLQATWRVLQSPAKPAGATDAGLPPQLAAAPSAEEAIKREAQVGYATILAFVTDWGGELLADVDKTAEALRALPAPLFVAIDQAVVPLLRELFPRRAEADPTMP